MICRVCKNHIDPQTADAVGSEILCSTKCRDVYEKQIDELYKLDKKPLSVQVAGNHYKEMQIQPVEFCQKNGLGFCESSVIKYVSRHRNKNGAQDIRKAIHFLELLLELEYQEAK